MQCLHRLFCYEIKNDQDLLVREITGAIAQLGERLICIQEVSSSILLSSTTFIGL